MKNNSSLFLGSFFESDSSAKVNLALSYDGERFEKLSVPFLWANGGNGKVYGRDPSITYHEGWWLIAVSGYVENQYDVDCWRSRDLTVWELVRIKLGESAVCGKRLPGSALKTTDVWAPEWFVDNDNLYLVVSLRFYDDQTDINGTVVKSFKPFVAKCADVESLAFTTPEAISIESKNMIDGRLFRIYDTYYFAVKDEITKKIEVYFSYSAFGDFEKLAIVPFSSAAEGPAVAYLPDGHIRIYADFFDTKRWTYFVDTKDFITFSQEKPVLYTGRIKHGTVTNCMDFKNSDAAIADIATLFSTNSPELEGCKIHGLIESAETNNVNATELTWWPERGHCYFTEGLSGNVTINALPTVYPDGSYFYLIVRSKTPGAGNLTLKKAIGDIYHPSNGIAVFGSDLVIEAGSHSAERLFKMVCFDAQWWVEGVV